MNKIQLQWQLGQANSEQLRSYILENEFEKLRDAKAAVYSHRKSPFPIGITSLAFDNTGQYLLSSGEDGSVALWAMDETYNEGQLVNKRVQLARGSSKESGSVSRRGTHISVRERGRNAPRFQVSVESRSASASEESRDAMHAFSITSVQWYGADNGLFFTGSNDHKVKVWDTNAFEVASTIDVGHRVVQLDVQGDLLAVASEDSHPRLIDLASMSAAITLGVKRTDMRYGINTAKFARSDEGSPQQLLATGDDDGNVRLWDLRMGNRALCDLQEPDSLAKPHARCCNDLCWDPSGANRIVTTGNDGKCKLWEISPDGSSQLLRQIGATDLTSNRFRRRTSHYLMWHGQYIFYNSDHGEILVFGSHHGRQWHSFEYPLHISHPDRLRAQPRFQSMAMQTSLANSVGLRLVLGTDNTHGKLLEYRA